MMDVWWLVRCRQCGERGCSGGRIRSDVLIQGAMATPTVPSFIALKRNIVIRFKIPWWGRAIS